MKTLIFIFLLFPVLLFSQVKPGDKAPDFQLKNVDGKTVSLHDYDGQKGVILIFTCNHCPFAQMYEQRIMDLNTKFAAQGFPVVAINPNDPKVAPDDSYANMQVRAKEKGYAFPYLFDEKQKVFPAYGATKTPHVFLLLKENGVFMVKYIGAIDDNAREEAAVVEKFVEEAIASLLKGEAVKTTETKAIGCSIKVKS